MIWLTYSSENQAYRYLSDKEAALAYNFEAKKYFGEFAKLNEVN